jgi:transposase-like protein
MPVSRRPDRPSWPAGNGLRSTNGLERLDTEIQRCPRIATLVLNKASLPRLNSAVFCEISVDWETERRHVIMEAK